MSEEPIIRYGRDVPCGYGIFKRPVEHKLGEQCPFTEHPLICKDGCRIVEKFEETHENGECCIALGAVIRPPEEAST
jgi:hypothetical protein